MECQRCKKYDDFKIQFQKEILKDKKSWVKRNISWILVLHTIIISLLICNIILYLDNELVNAVFKGFGCAYLGSIATWLLKEIINSYENKSP